ncbi:MAG: PIN domain-containing protein [Thermodesulfobacteriota bacterium]
MIIADTSIWIEFLKNKEPIVSLFEEKLNSRDIIGVSCVFGELLQGCSDENEIKMVKGYWDNIPKTEETNVWVEAGEYSGRSNLISRGVGLIDSVILVLAKRTKLKIWTLDKKLLKILNKETVFKM